ncbi:MAG: DUF1592 domain-containing protein [Tepidisphaeraceae bacterium]
MNSRSKKGLFAAIAPAVWAGASLGLISWIATGCLEQPSGKMPSAQVSAPVAIAPPPPPAPVANPVVVSYHQAIEPILQARCYQCHSGDDNQTPVAFDKLKTDDSIANNPDLWLKVLRNTRSHIMPPAGQDPPTADEQAKLEKWIEYSAFAVDPNNLDPGQQTIRRLNRTEYHNTVQDLIGVDFDVDTQFPSDDIGYGFDNIGDVLNISSMLMEKYVQAAQTIVSQGVEVNPRTMPVITVPGSRFSDGAANGRAGAPNGGRGGGGGGGPGGGTLDLNFANEAKVTHTFNVIYEGDYDLVLDWNVKGSFNFAPDRCTIAYAVDGKNEDPREYGWHDDYTGMDQLTVHWTPGKHTFTIILHPIKLKPKPASDIAPKLAAAGPTPPALADAGKPANADPTQLALAEAPKPATADAAPPDAAGSPKSANADTSQPPLGGAAKPANGSGNAPRGGAGAAGAAKTGRGGAGRGNFPPQPPPTVSFRVLKVRLEGPRDQAYWVASPGYKKFFPRAQVPQDDQGRRQYAREILLPFATKAFRRPVPDETINRLVDIAVSAGDAPDSTFEKGVAQAMVAILASPRFLYRVEAAEPLKGNSPFAKCDEYTLASRLSYFLWSTMPDDELSNLAARGELRANLQAQINRMLADPRSQNLVENFTGQWLQSREVAAVPINPHEIMLREGVTVPIATQLPAPVRTALEQEPQAYFAYVMHNDRSVKEFLDSDYTFLNQTLAQFYNIPGVTGQQMRKVTVDPSTLRGGALTMGSTLMVTSNPTRTSPVKRGKWVLENILGAPAPPPPPDIPPLELAANQFKDKQPTLREILAAHRANPQCASCHDRMDPLGLAMENFNAEGLYRKQELDQPIDASGQLITGEKFKDVSDLKKALVNNHLDEFYRCLTEKLLTYATGRGMEYYDMPTIDNIVDQLDHNDGRFSTLLLGVIDSAPFQEQRVAKPSVLAEGTR